MDSGPSLGCGDLLRLTCLEFETFLILKNWGILYKNLYL